MKVKVGFVVVLAILATSIPCLPFSRMKSERGNGVYYCPGCNKMVSHPHACDK